MKQPSREIIENARKAANIPDSSFNCNGINCSKCPYMFEYNKICENNIDSNQQFFKDFLAKYDTEDTMDTEKEIEALKARIEKLEGKDTYPCIKTDGETVILFSGVCSGMVLHDDDGEFTTGSFSTEWDECLFTTTLTEYTIKV